MSVLIISIIKVFSYDNHSPCWFGKAKMSNGKIYQGVFFVCGTHVPFFYKSTGTISTFDGPVEQTDGYPIIDKTRLQITPETLKCGEDIDKLAKRKTDSSRYVVPEITHSEFYNESPVMYLNPFVFIFKDQAFDKFTAMANENLEKLQLIATIMEDINDTMSNVNKNRPLCNIIHAMLHPIIEAMFGIDLITTMQFSILSLCQFMNNLYSQGFHELLSNQSHIRHRIEFIRGMGINDVISPTARANTGKIENVVYYEIPPAFQRLYGIALRHKTDPNICYIFDEHSAHRFSNGDRLTFDPKKTTPADVKLTRVIDHVKTNQNIDIVYGINNSMFFSVGPQGLTYPAASSCRHRCNVTIKFPPILKKDIDANVWAKYLVKHLLWHAHAQRGENGMVLSDIERESATILETKGADHPILNHIREFAKRGAPAPAPAPAVKYVRIDNEIRLMFGRFHLTGILHKERVIARVVKQLINFGEYQWDCPTFVLKLAHIEILQTLNTEQRTAFFMLMNNRIGMVNGGPGTGKTFLLIIFAHLMRQIVGDDAIFLFLSFKNDTVNRTKQLILNPPANLQLNKLTTKTTESNCIFMTCDHFDAKRAHGPNPDMGFNTPYAVIVDEAAQMSTEHLYAITQAYGTNIQKLCMFGDSRQLPNPKNSMPFHHLVTPDPRFPEKISVTHSLVHTERTSGTGKMTIDAVVESITQMDYNKLMSLSANHNGNQAAIANSAFCVDTTTLPSCRSRSDIQYINTYGIMLKTLYNTLNPNRELEIYRKIMCTCPVNDMLFLFNCVINVLQFENRWFTPAEYAEVCQHTSSLVPTQGQAQIQTQPGFKKNKLENMYYKNMKVIFTETDKKEENGLYGKSEKGYVIGFAVASKMGPIPTARIVFENSPIAKSTYNVSDSRCMLFAMIGRENAAPVVLPVKNGREKTLYSTVKCGNAISVHACQGNEANVVIALAPKTVNMANNAILLTMASRAREQLFIISDEETLRKSCITPYVISHSNIPDLMDVTSEAEADDVNKKGAEVRAEVGDNNNNNHDQTDENPKIKVLKMNKNE